MSLDINYLILSLLLLILLQLQTEVSYDGSREKILIFIVENTTVHMKNEKREHFVQYAGTFTGLFMLLCDA